MKKGMIIILVILILVIGSSFFGYYLYKDYKCSDFKNEGIEASLHWLKCLSLCPEHEIFESDNTIKKTMSPDCKDFCNNYWDDFYNSELVLSYAEKCYQKNSPKENYYWISLNIINICGPTDDINSQECYAQEVAKHYAIRDLSDMQLDYPYYDLSIIDLTCNEGSAEITVKYVGDQNYNVGVVALMNNNFINKGNNEIITSGETKIIQLKDPSITNGSLIGVALKIQKNGKDWYLDISDNEFCP